VGSHWYAFTHGTSGLVMEYLVVFVPMVIALIRSRAPVSEFLLSPLLAVFWVLIAALIIWLVLIPVHAIGVSDDGLISWVVAMTLAAGIGYVGGLGSPSNSVSQGKHSRGAVITNRPGSDRGRPDLDSRSANDAIADAPVELAGLKITQADEVKHFKLIGTTGTGKSTAIRELLSGALARGDRAIIADPDGGYLQQFFDPARGDVILNPFEPDSMKWNLLSEITNEYDVDQLARSLIPDGGSDKSWSEYARTFFTSVTQQVIRGGIRDDAEVYRLVTRATSKELKVLLEGTAAGPFLEDSNDRMFGSVRAVTSSAVHALKYTTRKPGPPFSVRQWVKQGSARKHGGRGGVLFLPYRAGEIAALRAIISAWVRIAVFEAMNQGEGDQRLWFVVDELDALGEIDGLKDALARLRKFGGRCVLGFQSISQVSATYGKGVADTIVENCGNTLILRCSASEQGGTSQFASKLIGQREVMHTTKSRTRRSTEWVASTTTSEHRTIEPAIMASEIERLPDLEGYLKIVSNPDWLRVTLRHVSYSTRERARQPVVRVTPEVAVVTPPSDPPENPKATKPKVSENPTMASTDRNATQPGAAPKPRRQYRKRVRSASTEDPTKDALQVKGGTAMDGASATGPAELRSASDSSQSRNQS
jgi:type IV secretory pathway TraG/TraD family ATPase VirD4